MSATRPFDPVFAPAMRGVRSSPGDVWLTPDDQGALVSPLSIMGSALRLWLYGGARIVGNPVDSWTDNTLTQNAFTGSLTARPALGAELGISVPDFDGSNDYLASTSTFANIAGASAWEIWMVVSADTLVADPSVFQIPGVTEGLGGHGVGFSASGARAFTTTAVGGTTGTGFVALSTGSRALIRGGYDGANVYVSVNGGALTTAAKTGALTSTTGTLRIGANYNLTLFCDSRICDVIAVNRAVTSGEATSLTAYFKARWSIP